MAVIANSDLTDKTVAGTPGTGTFDVLMESSNLYLQEQYNEDRITGAEFATVYLGTLQAVLSQAVQFLLGQQAADKQAELLVAKKILVEAQTLGFASDTKQKILKQMHDGYAVNLSIAGVGNVPEADQDAAIDDLTQELLIDVGSSVVIATGEVSPPAA